MCVCPPTPAVKQIWLDAQWNCSSVAEVEATSAHRRRNTHTLLCSSSSSSSSTLCHRTSQVRGWCSHKHGCVLCQWTGSVCCLEGRSSRLSRTMRWLNELHPLVVGVFQAVLACSGSPCLIWLSLSVLVVLAWSCCPCMTSYTRTLSLPDLLHAHFVLAWSFTRTLCPCLISYTRTLSLPDLLHAHFVLAAWSLTHVLCPCRLISHTRTLSLPDLIQAHFVLACSLTRTLCPCLISYTHTLSLPAILHTYFVLAWPHTRALCPCLISYARILSLPDLMHECLQGVLICAHPIIGGNALWSWSQLGRAGGFLHFSKATLSHNYTQELYLNFSEAYSHNYTEA